MLKSLSVAILALATALPVAAQPAPTLFPVTRVDRDTVPAGTPAAFAAAFGPSPRNEAVRQVNGERITYVPLALIPLGGGTVALVSTGQSACTGHACSGVNAVQYLRGSAADYEKVGELVEVGAAGTWGNPATSWGWTDAITGTPVLYTEGGGTWQGYTCTLAALTELRPTGPVEIASIPIAYSDASRDNGTTLEGRITAAERGRSFTVSYTGSRNFSERYVRRGDGRYTLEGRSQVETC